MRSSLIRGAPGRLSAFARAFAHRLAVLGCFCMVVACARTARVAQTSSVERVDGLRKVERRHAEHYWEQHGYVEMVPPVRLPTTHDHRDVTRVWLKLPKDSEIAVDWLRDQGRYTVQAPAGTRADRVEYERYRTGAGWGEAVVDVRGWTLGAEGPSRFVVLRAGGGKPQDPLLGWSWPAGDLAAQRAATHALMQLVTHEPRPVERPALRGEAAELFAKRNDCIRCHRSNKQRDVRAEQADVPERATDASGGYALVMMLARRVPLSRARPIDENVADPYVKIVCGGRVMAFPARTEQPQCPDEFMPEAFRDVAQGLADADPYTQKVCAARSYIHQHMTAAGHRAFREAFAECGLSTPSGSIEVSMVR